MNTWTSVTELLEWEGASLRDPAMVVMPTKMTMVRTAEPEPKDRGSTLMAWFTMGLVLSGSVCPTSVDWWLTGTVGGGQRTGLEGAPDKGAQRWACNR